MSDEPRAHRSISSLSAQRTFSAFAPILDAKEYHESQTNCEDVLRTLRKGANITKFGWEQSRSGSRLAPAVDVLRNGYGFEIGGDGSTKSPYFLLDLNQWPTKVRTTEAMKAAYYEHNHWRTIRDQRFEHDGYRCKFCIGNNNCGLQCHHIVYDIFNESLEDLITVCTHHHEVIHRNSRIGFPIGVSLQAADALVGYHEFEGWLQP